MWGRYIALILDEDHPTFRAVNPTSWIKSELPGFDWLVQQDDPVLRDGLLAWAAAGSPQAEDPC